MPKFAANLGFLYGEFTMLERFAAAAADGFAAVEIPFPYEYSADSIVEQLKLHNLSCVLINAPPGDWAKGERGLATRSSKVFTDSIEEALRWAVQLGCPHVHVMSGTVDVSPPADKASLTEQYIKNLTIACTQARDADIQICIEPINSRDMPDYFLNSPVQAMDIITSIGMKNLKLQLDVYHYQVICGDVSSHLRHAFSTGRLGHVQIAGAPDRQEPDRGELRVEYLIELLDELGYDGYIGCEYRPRGSTSTGLTWIRKWLPSSSERAD